MGLVFLVDCSASSSLLHVHTALDIMDTYPDDIECSVYYFNQYCDCLVFKKKKRYISFQYLMHEFHSHGSTALYDAVCSVLKSHSWWDKVYIITDNAGDTSSKTFTKDDMKSSLAWRPFTYIVKVDTETQELGGTPGCLAHSQTTIFDSAILDEV